MMAGHAIQSSSRATMLGILHSHALLEPAASYAEGVSYLREYGASLLWIDSTVFSVAAMLSMPA